MKIGANVDVNVDTNVGVYVDMYVDNYKCCYVDNSMVSTIKPGSKF